MTRIGESSMCRSVRLGLALVLTLLVLLPTIAPPRVSAQAQDGATLTVLRGQVAVVRTDGSAVQPAPSGTVVRAGDEIRTLNRTGALITFFVGTEIEMGEETILAVEQVSIDGGKVDIALKQVLGTTLNRVQSLTDPTSTYRIDAGGATAVVRGTTFLLIGPVPTSSGNISALICMEDCDGRTTFAGCAVAPYTAFGVTVANNRPTSGCSTTGVGRGVDYFNAGFEAVTAFEQTFANDSSDVNPGVANLGVDPGQRRANERRQQEDRDDQPTAPPAAVAQVAHVPAAVTLSACQLPSSPPTTSTPTLFPGFDAVQEGNAGTVTLNFQVFLFPASSSTVMVNYATADASATAGTDYVATSGMLTFPPGLTSQTVPITVNGDVTVETDELIAVNLSNPVGAPLAFSNGFGRIIDDDSPIEINVLDDAVFEGNAGTTTLVHTVTLSRTSPTPISVDYLSIAGGTASPGSDFQTAPTTTLTIPANTDEATFTITVFGDTTPEPDETALVQIQNPSGGATIVDANATGTILDDDGPPRIAITGDSLHEGCEGTTTATFSVDLSTPQVSTVTVNFTTANGTATAGSDYQPTSGTVTFAPGNTSQTIEVSVLGDTVLEPDETFTVNLSGASPGSVTILTPSATGTILNDD